MSSLSKKGRSACTKPPLFHFSLQFAVIYCSWERDYVTDIAHTCQVHHAALKSKSETCMSCRTIFSQIQIEVTEQIHNEELSLPMSPVMTKEEVNNVVDILNHWEITSWEK